MKKLTDQEIDSVFKDAAEGYKPPFDMAAWEAMNEKLNQPAKASFLSRHRWIVISLAGLVIFSGGVWLGTNVGKEEWIEGEKTNTLVQVPLNTSEIKNAIDENHDRETNISKSNSSSKEIIKLQVGIKKTRVDKQLPPNAFQKYVKTPLDINTGRVHSIRGNTYMENENRGGLGGDSVLDSLTDLSFPPNFSEIKTQTEGTKDSVIEVARLTRSDTALSQLQDLEKKVNTHASHAIFLRVLASPDFSAVNFSSVKGFGSNYTIQVEYALNSRWSFGTGAIWSVKKYATSKETSYGTYTTDELNGVCKIIDIPINAFYHFVSRSKVSFNVGFGLSSYIMLHEDYTYLTTTSKGVYNYSTSVSNKNNEWFKLLNLTLQAQYQLLPRWQIQVEPFLKVPLAGVGEGKILLSSMGIFVGLKYKIK
jgi:hypothetical protein